jgi:hypothetical protein
MIDALTDEEILAVREHPGVWFDTFAWVEDRAKQLRKADPANAIQRELFRIYAWCQDNGVQCNIIGLKSRKEGLSTGATALAYHHLSEHRAEGVVIGTDNETSDTLTGMIQRYASNDGFDWGSRMTWKPSENRGSWAHGSTVKRDTAIDPKAGRSSTVQVLIATEVAHWPAAGVRSADETMLSILNSMPDIPNIMRVVDSTANGATGWFYDTYTDAVTFEERKAGKVGNGWIKVFEPWHASPLRRVNLSDEQEAETLSALTDREKAGIDRYGWTAGQIQWRRETIGAKCGGDEQKFDQEYPESEHVAFLTSGSPRFNVARVGRMMKLAQEAWSRTLAGANHAPRLGHLVEGVAGVIFMPSSENAWLWVSEPPEYGRSYLHFVDPMTGEQSRGAKVRDTHAPGIMRAPYVSERGEVHHAAVVACLYEPDGCRWEMDVLADRMRLLQRWYGDCLIVPEVNKAMDLIPLLRQRGATNLYHRPVKPDASNPSEKQKAVGFYTSESTRNLWVNALSEAIREDSFECLFLPAVVDFSHMITTPSGRAEAAPKKHDDWCAGVGLGLLTLPQATRLSPPRPATVRQYAGSSGGNNGGGWE